MKKWLPAILLCFCMVLVALPMNVMAQGSGTITDPYRISSFGEMKEALESSFIEYAILMDPDNPMIVDVPCRYGYPIHLNSETPKTINVIGDAIFSFEAPYNAGIGLIFMNDGSLTIEGNGSITVNTPIYNTHGGEDFDNAAIGIAGGTLTIHEGVTIKGKHSNSLYSRAIYQTGGTIVIHGGILQGSVSHINFGGEAVYIKEGSAHIYGGTFGTDQAWGVGLRVESPLAEVNIVKGSFQGNKPDDLSAYVDKDSIALEADVNSRAGVLVRPAEDDEYVLLHDVDFMVQAPVVGAMPQNNVATLSHDVTISLVRWYLMEKEDKATDIPEAFEAGQTYRCVISFGPRNIVTITDDFHATINSEPSAFLPAEGTLLRCYYDFTLEAETLSPILDDTDEPDPSPIIPDDDSSVTEPSIPTPPEPQEPAAPIVLTIGSTVVSQNGEPIEPSPVAARIINGRTMLPFRYLIQTLLGGSVGWDEATRTVSALINGISFTMTIDNQLITVDGKEIDYGQAPVIVDGYTLVPLRVFEAAVADIQWLPTTQEVIIVPNP